MLFFISLIFLSTSLVVESRVSRRTCSNIKSIINCTNDELTNIPHRVSSSYQSLNLAQNTIQDLTLIHSRVRYLPISGLNAPPHAPCSPLLLPLVAPPSCSLLAPPYFPLTSPQKKWGSNGINYITIKWASQSFLYCSGADMYKT